uniref:Uncharacterized protein n=1 Tax=Solanum lycopersicum TaxID=4081 RepID=A0A3Q7IBB5_SOLLC
MKTSLCATIPPFLIGLREATKMADDTSVRTLHLKVEKRKTEIRFEYSRNDNIGSSKPFGRGYGYTLRPTHFRPSKPNNISCLIATNPARPSRTTVSPPFLGSTGILSLIANATPKSIYPYDNRHDCSASWFSEVNRLTSGSTVPSCPRFKHSAHHTPKLVVDQGELSAFFIARNNTSIHCITSIFSQHLCEFTVGFMFGCVYK